MVTAAPSSRTARALVALALAGSAATLGLGATAAWADPTPAPDVVTTDPVAADPPPDAPAAPPVIGSWIIGGTELEATAAKPVAKPVVKPAARPVAKPAAVAPVRTVRAASTGTTPRAASRTTTPTTTRIPAAADPVTAAPSATAPDGATALPFTGGHVDALLPTGIALLVGGVALTLASRPRRSACA